MRAACGKKAIALVSAFVYNDSRKNQRVVSLPDRSELEFEWDDEKNTANVKKHGIDFEDAILVFNDENYIEFYDPAHSEEEDRYNIIGLVEDVLFVVYTERKQRIRIISARLATAMERRMYYDRNA